MFTWICPKCGMEVPPSYSDCPNCAAESQNAGVAPAQEKPPSAFQPAPPRRRRSALFGLAMTVLVALVILAAGAGAWRYLRSQPERQAAAESAPALETPEAQALAAPPSGFVLKNLELTGLRLTEDPKQKTLVQFVVVNHSGADLGEVSAKAELKAVVQNGKETERVGAFVFKTKLGPYEAKDMRVPLATQMRVYELPDWQFLRAEFAVQ